MFIGRKRELATLDKLHDFTTFTDDTPAAGLAVLRP